ncbi:MSMEG_0565 family glycosyltransferase [Romeria aff. gracilis LEGE 07310]|uniref:MSMEG_0565 family glycosyltransferase n=1 Tax=Vasconcelosia minhoensis LEGE 07310 TaxID=915328 RepID=A0A8J7AMQ2_9CYAN|nr:MSMEG_0565 family glycosyltransferase [Romeria aff. gracilis LEGE 07310]
MGRCDTCPYGVISAAFLKIALLTYATKPRGSVIHTLELAEALHRLGHQPCVFALDKTGQGFGRSLLSKVALVPASPCDQGIEALIQQRIGEFVRYFQQHRDRYDIYHAQDCLSANALAQLRDQGQLPHFVRTVHHIEAFQSPYLQDCQEKSIRLPDRCLCVSDYWQKELEQRYGIQPFRVFNGVDWQRFSAPPENVSDLKAELGLTGQPIYLTVGGIEPRKNSLRLLQAFAQVLPHLPQAQLVIAGGATLFDYEDYRADFFAAVAELGIDARSLILPGIIPDAQLPALYHAAAGFVFPSLKEGWGLVVLEAIAAGLPVLTANQTPFTEYLSPQTACLVDPNDTDQIAQGMLNLAQPQTVNAWVTASRSLRDRYRWQDTAQLHLTLYTQLLFPQ